MAHFAKLDDNNIVIDVIVVHNNELLDNGFETEAKGISFCQSLFGGKWKQTSYNSNFRKNFATVGYVYDSVRDAFIPPKPYNSWILNEESCIWVAPIELPKDNNKYIWDEGLLNWIQQP
jgi:hypothetical protein